MLAGAYGGHKRKRKRERYVVGIICVIIYDDLALEAWTQSIYIEREREKERKIHNLR